MRSQGVVSTGSGINEDAFGHTGEAAWVIDGATGLTDKEYTDYESDGLWYVEYVSELLEKNISNEETLQSILRDIVTSAEQRYTEVINNDDQILEEEKPSAAISLLRWDADTVEYFILGDCSAVIERNSDIMVTLGEGPRKLDKKVVEKMRQLMSEGMSYAEAKDESSDMLRDHRRMKNKEEGYWTLGFDENAMSHALTGTIPTEEFIRGYLFTDGFEPIVETYDVFRDWRAAVNYLGENGMKRAIKILRAIEEADPECKKYPRLKPSDDIAIVEIKNHESK
jgi:uncharacterized protein YoaH (UPF0181 family)